MAELDEAALQRALLERFRFERAMGLEFVQRGEALRAPEATPAETSVAELASPRSTAPSAPAARVTTAPSAAPPPASLSEATSAATLSPEEKAARWKDLEARALGCAACVLHKGRKNVVFGDGNRNAQLVFVGEGPGADEDAQGLPFVGRAGQLLNKIIGAMKLQRQDVYICNVVKCRPPENRTPLPDEIGACQPFLTEQLELINPKVIVALGSPAAKTLLKTTQGIMSIRGKWFSYRGIPVMPTYHPAFLLRSYTEENRRAVWEDIKKAMEKLSH